MPSATYSATVLELGDGERRKPRSPFSLLRTRRSTVGAPVSLLPSPFGRPAVALALAPAPDGGFYYSGSEKFPPFPERFSKNSRSRYDDLGYCAGVLPTSLTKEK
nr:hypothetical protein Iba_chr10bCG5440 [Ipomoea batatas]